MNYTIFTREQVTPKTRIVADVADTTRTILNPGNPPVYPFGSYVVYEPADLDIYSDNPAVRRVLLADPAGTATIADINAAFPLYGSVLMDEVRGMAQAHILTVYPLWYQLNVANGLYGQPIANTMRDDIAAVITESNRCEQLIYDGQPYTINFPAIGG